MIPSTGTIDVEKIRVTDIQTTLFFEHYNPEFLQVSNSPKETGYRGDYTVLFSLEQRSVRFEINHVLTQSAPTVENALAQALLNVGFDFEVENLADFCIQSEKGLAVNPTLGATLLGIALSTSRGIFHARLNPIHWKGALIPVLNPITFLKENIRQPKK